MLHCDRSIDSASEERMFNNSDQSSLLVLAANTASQANTPIAVIVAAIGALATCAVGLLNYTTQRRNFQWQRDQQVRQLDLTLSSQLTDRFTKAIDQLGSSNKTVRIGGIFALERIARDSQQDRANIISTLATFIRESQPSSAVKAQAYVPMLKIRAPDIQAAMAVLCRSPLCDDRANGASTDLLDLSRTDLRRASLSGAHLERVNLWGARLEGANLRGAHLQGAVLSGAHVGRFDPSSTRYEFGADLSDADLTDALLDDTIDLHLTKRSINTRGILR
jgi:uncharacterized protein YjbI with pentapeptide repeats